MKHIALFSSKDKSKNLKCRLLQFLFGALRVKGISRRDHLHIMFVEIILEYLSFIRCAYW